MFCFGGSCVTVIGKCISDTFDDAAARVFQPLWLIIIVYEKSFDSFRGRRGAPAKGP